MVRVGAVREEAPTFGYNDCGNDKFCFRNRNQLVAFLPERYIILCISLG